MNIASITIKRSVKTKEFIESVNGVIPSLRESISLSDCNLNNKLLKPVYKKVYKQALKVCKNWIESGDFCPVLSISRRDKNALEGKKKELLNRLDNWTLDEFIVKTIRRVTDDVPESMKTILLGTLITDTLDGEKKWLDFSQDLVVSAKKFYEGRMITDFDELPGTEEYLDIMTAMMTLYMLEFTRSLDEESCIQISGNMPDIYGMREFFFTLFKGELLHEQKIIEEMLLNGK